MGKSVGNLSAKESASLRKLQLGFIFQSYNLLQVHTVYENVEFPLLLLKTEAGKRKQMIMDALEWVGLILTLTAFDPEMAYQVRKLWVDQERNIPLREELYAKSGSFLKRTEMSNVESIHGRWFPKRIVFKDVLREGEGTEFIIEEIQFNAVIPDYVFSKGSLK